jgi:hypothetical protein
MSTYKRDDELIPFSYQPYQKSDAVKQADDLLQQHAASKPFDYQFKYQADMDSLRSQIQNRKAFQYDVNGDALYQQYKDRFIHNGQRAMQDTMGQAAALTGGYGSSYAQNVGQQAYNEYMTGLNDVIPELYQLAKDKYDRETASLMDQYAMLADLDARDYSRHQDDQNYYYDELDRLTENARYVAKQDYDQYMADYDTAYKKHQEDAEVAAKQQATENAPLDKYKFAGIDNDGNYRYYKGDKQVTYAQGINPHTGTRNKDVQYGTFGQSGYQPNNIGGVKLKKSNMTAMINGHEQNVWYLPDGNMYLWDDTVNRYVSYITIKPTGNTARFKQSVPSKSAFGGGQGYQEYVENKIDEWAAAGKLTDDEVATLLQQYGFVNYYE